MNYIKHAGSSYWFVQKKVSSARTNELPLGLGPIRMSDPVSILKMKDSALDTFQ